MLHGRIRFVLDHAATWHSTTDWSVYLQPRTADLPEEVSALVTEIIDEEPPNEPITELASTATTAFRDAGLQFEEELVRRFAASLLAKRFVILTGLSGSGKTKLARHLLPGSRLDIPVPASTLKSFQLERTGQRKKAV